MSLAPLEIIPRSKATCCFCNGEFKEDERIIWLVLTDCYPAEMSTAQTFDMAVGDLCIDSDWKDTATCHRKCLRERGFDFGNEGKPGQKTV